MENFPYIPFIPDKKTVMRRLGSQKAAFAPALESEINGYLRLAESAFAVQGRANVYDLMCREDGRVVLSGAEVFSPQLARLLYESSKAYLMCTTIPQKDVDKINAAMQQGRGLKAIVLDAYASECVDGALDVIMDRKNAALGRTGQRLTKRRFSAGYGDLDIKYQKVFYDLLDMQTTGVRINDQFLLSPEKSVIAIAGVE